MNKSKIRSPTHWRKMHAAGAVEGIGAAIARRALAGVESVEDLAALNAPVTGPMPALEVKAGWTMDADDLADALEADEPNPFIGRPSEVADAIIREEDARVRHAAGITDEDVAASFKAARAADVVLRITKASTTVPEAARALGVHPTTVRRRLARGTYQGTQDTNGMWSVTDPTILEVVNANAQGV